MSRRIEDGGPAYPQVKNTGMATVGLDGAVHLEKECAGGMSLRDWFAGQALTGHIAHLGAQNIHAGAYASECATEAYRLADAMLAAREPQAEPEGLDDAEIIGTPSPDAPPLTEEQIDAIKSGDWVWQSGDTDHSVGWHVVLERRDGIYLKPGNTIIDAVRLSCIRAHYPHKGGA